MDRPPGRGPGRRPRQRPDPSRGRRRRAAFRARDIAVMYRMNAQSRAIEESFLRYGIRYQLVGGTRFYSRREVKDALAYLRVLRSDTDSVSFERIINVPARGIGDKTIEALRAAAAREGGSTWGAIEAAVTGELPGLAPRTRNALAEFAVLVRRLRTRVGVLALPELLDEALEASGYRAMLADGSEDGEERWANLLELRAVTTRYDDLTPDDALDRLLEETALVADQDSYEGDADAVTLITLHAAKGLEFPVVFIAGLEEGLFPHSRALDDEKELEEERRLAYVGITRAKRRLFLSHAWRRATWGMGQAVRAVAVPDGDPGRADGRAAARRRRTSATSTSTSCSGRGGRAGSGRRRAGPGRRTGRGAAGRARPRPARRSGRRATSPPSARRTTTGRGPARSGARSVPGTTTSTPRAAAARRRARRAGRPAPGHPRRARIPRRRPRPPRPLGRRHRRDLQADPQRRGGHGRVQGRLGRPQDDAGQPRQPRHRRMTERRRRPGPGGAPRRARHPRRLRAARAPGDGARRRTTTWPAGPGTS